MGTINQKKTPRTAIQHKNWMGGESYHLSDAVKNLRLAASSCFFGEPQYYHVDSSRTVTNRALNSDQLNYLRKTLDAIDPIDWRGKSPAEMMESAIDRALDQDPEGTLIEAVRLRNEEHIRTTPQVILVRAAHHPSVKGSGMLAVYGPEIVKRADEPCVGLAYHFSRYGKNVPIPNALKKVWRNVLQSFDEYQLAKYRMQDREVKLVDVVNLVHAKSPAITKLMRGELKNTRTWESIISSEGSNLQSWQKAFDVMGHMALLRNMRNLLQKSGVEPKLLIEKLLAGVEHGKQLPFRYYSAYKSLQHQPFTTGKVLDGIEAALVKSLRNVPPFKGRLMALSDNSGSAWGCMTSEMGTMAVADIANLTAVIAAMCADDGHVGVFGDSLETFTIRPNASVFDQLEKVTQAGRMVGSSTENGVWLFWRNAIERKEHWDHVFIMSDMQAGHGGLYGTNPGSYWKYAWPSNPRMIDVASLVNKYRQTVNPNVNVYLVQMAGYQDTIIPEFYKKTYILGGWGEGLLKFAATMAGLDQ